jgi:RNA polymerase sigma-70 factor (ECF subfamily)
MSTNLLGWASELAQTHAAPLLAVARAEGLTATDALDATQEAFHTLLSLPQARGFAGEREDAERLMTLLVRNAARNMRRRHHRARPHADWETLDAAPTDEPSVEQLIARAEEHVALLGCVRQLAEVQRQVVTLRLLEEVALPRVATELGLTEGNVALLMHRAKKALRACLLS